LVAIVSYEIKRVFDGVAEIYFFHNGRGASVVRHNHSYGGEFGLWELAVLKGSTETWDIDYTTEITSDVLGHLSDEGVSHVLSLIEALENVDQTEILETYRT
jgi:hypothetical protein